jgi:hypothetical protein
MTPKQIEKELEKLSGYQADAESAVEAYGEKAMELAEAIREYMGERSESWQEGEKGQAYEALATELENTREYCSVEGVPALDL